MAVLEKIRVKFGLVISIIIALALLSFIIDPGTLESALNSMSSKYDVGKIAGKNISYNDFQEDVDKYTVINEMLSGSSSQNEQTQRQIRNAAWQGLLDKYMFVKNAKAAASASERTRWFHLFPARLSLRSWLRTRCSLTKRAISLQICSRRSSTMSTATSPDSSAPTGIICRTPSTTSSTI